MMKDLLLAFPHRRYNPLKDEWILVSPQRTKRPWQGKREGAQKENRSFYDPNCYLCPGNFRVGKKKNPDYQNTYVFANDFPALVDAKTQQNKKTSDLFKVKPVKGACRVVCFSSRHNLTLSEMKVSQIEKVIKTWIKEIDHLKSKYRWIQVFENKGEMMGCSNPHPHGQIWAGNFLPNEIEKEDQAQKKYFENHQNPLLHDYSSEEIKQKERIVFENSHWMVLVPFWAIWPFETILIPKRQIPSLISVSESEISDLAKIMKNLLVAYDRLFNISMPYSMGWHFAPFNNKDNRHWQLHAHYYPPLLRSATVKKYMVGYEMLSEAQRDITPEEAAEKLRKLL